MSQCKQLTLEKTQRTIKNWHCHDGTQKTHKIRHTKTRHNTEN